MTPDQTNIYYNPVQKWHPNPSKFERPDSSNDRKDAIRYGIELRRKIEGKRILAA